MQTQLTVLNNGLHVVSKKDETTGMFNIGVWCRCGSRFETPAQNGIAHFCEHMTFKGTTTRSELEINEQIADLGGKSNAWTDMDTTAFSIEVLNCWPTFCSTRLSPRPTSTANVRLSFRKCTKTRTTATTVSTTPFHSWFTAASRWDATFSAAGKRSAKSASPNWTPGGSAVTAAKI